MARSKNSEGGAEIGLLAEAGNEGKGERIRAAILAFARGARDGSMLPSERVLAEQFQVARMTVRGAIDSLEVEGRVKRVPGRGAFVLQPRLVHSDIFRSFSEDMRVRGMEPGAREFSIQLKSADEHIAERLDVAPGSMVVAIERVRTADGIPMALESSNLPAERFPGLEKMMTSADSLYELLGRNYGVRLEGAEQTISVISLSEAEGSRLEVAPHAPAFAIERVTKDNMGKCVEFGRSLYRGDRYAVEMRVGRGSGA